MAAKVAILLAGALRTFERCALLLRRNLVDCNHSPVVFALVEGSEDEEAVRVLLRTHLGHDLRIGAVLAKPSFRTPEYVHYTQTVLPTRPAMTPAAFAATPHGIGLQGYIYNGGTVLQYYQLALLWRALETYERHAGVLFSAVIRGRWDGLLTVPLPIADWHGFAPGPRGPAADPLDTRCLGNPHLEAALPRLCRGKGLWWDDNVPPGASCDRVVWTFGSEQLWVASRDTFALLVRIYDEYGQIASADHPVPMDSESVFHLHCRRYGILHWNFQEEGNPRFNHAHSGTAGAIQADPYMFTLVR